MWKYWASHNTANRSNLSSINDTTQMHDEGLASSKLNLHTPTLPSRHRRLILRCAHNLFLHTAPKTAFTTQHCSTRTYSTRPSPPVILSVRQAFNMSLARELLRRISDLGLKIDSSDSRWPWYAVKGNGKMTIRIPNAFELRIMVLGAWWWVCWGYTTLARSALSKVHLPHISLLQSYAPMVLQNLSNHRLSHRKQRERC